MFPPATKDEPTVAPAHRPLPRGWRWALIAAGVVAALVGIGYLFVGVALDRALTSAKLREGIGQKTGAILQADAGYLPLKASGLTISSDGFVAHGKPPSALTALEARGLQARCDLGALWHRVWRVDELRIEHVQAAYGEAAARRFIKPELPSQPQTEAPVDKASPLHVEIARTLLDRADLSWGKLDDEIGYLLGVNAVCTTVGKGMNIKGTGGAFRQSGWPEFKVGSLQLTYNQPELRIVDARLTQTVRKPGDLGMSGAIQFTGPTPLDLALRLEHCDVTPFLPSGSRDNLEGRLSGQTQIHKELATQGPVDVQGELELTAGVLHGYPALAKIAAVTRHPEFKRLALRSVRGRYRYENGRLTVTDFHAESKGLMCAEGEFTIEKERIDGRFQLGAAAEVLNPIPGAREQVFTRAHDGYHWTALTLEGPIDHPRDNLKARLISAAEKQVAKTVLAPILKPGKEVLDLLKDL